ncbi:MAG: glycerol-3-phosphate 1-O-acyltransferase PlsY [Candidatus Limnocylindrales bacterium]
MQIDELARAVAAVVAGYLVGGIPWGVIIARLVGGPDPRTLGSGRTGGANVLRALGPRAAIASGLLDVAKGVIAVLFARLLGTGLAIEILAALAAILGHSRSPFLGLQGGRGVSAGIGGLLVLQPLVAAIIVPVFALVLLVSRYSSLASLTASTVGGLVVIAMTVASSLPPVYLAYGIVAPLMIWIFHADNVVRLLRGQERRFGQRGE